MTAFLHTMIRVTDPDATIAFFELIGVREVRRYSSEQGRFTLIFLAAPGQEGVAEVEEIDQLNILHATMLAMQRAVAGLHITPKLALIDGNRCPKLAMPAEAVVKGDSKVPAIAAASILAKVSRDREMAAFELIYPGYGIAGHKGYPTPVHLEALARLGPTPIHRRSFAPVRLAYELRGSLSEV